MLTTYFRSSSINAHSFCEQQYFLSYVLGIPDSSNKRAEQGTICHKVFECLALDKLSQQNSKVEYTDDAIGTFPVGTEPKTLLDLSFDYYTNKSVHVFTEKDREECLEWVHKALAYQDGNLDPRNRTIFATEQRFDFEIDKKWANYKFEYNGEKFEGNLAIKGCVDLITKIDDNTLEVIDWKTGRRIDWGTGEIKTYKKLRDDIQLRMYHYALSKLFPQYKNILISIYFINGFWHGTKEDKKWVPEGIYTVAFSKHDLSIFEKRLKAKFDLVRACQEPKLTKTWRCKSFCYYGKNLYPGTKDTICEHVRKKTKEDGIELVTLNYTDKNHNINKYNAPGE